MMTELFEKLKEIDNLRAYICAKLYNNIYDGPNRGFCDEIASEMLKGVTQNEVELTLYNLRKEGIVEYVKGEKVSNAKQLNLEKLKEYVESFNGNILNEEFIEVLEREHFLYIAKIKINNQLSACKIGVTSNDVAHRFMNDNTITIIDYKYIKLKNGIIARGLEQALLQHIIHPKYRLRVEHHRFSGYTECCLVGCYQNIIDYILKHFSTLAVINKNLPKFGEKLDLHDLGYEILLENKK